MIDGTIRIEILEGRYGAVRAEGHRHYSTRFIERFFAPARGSGIVHRGSLERAVLTLNNQFTDLKVQSVFDKGKEFGTTDIVLR